MKDLSIYDDVGGLERYLNLPSGTLRNVPIYARKPAVDAIMKVQEMERTSLFRPGLYYIVLADLCGNYLKLRQSIRDLNSLRGVLPSANDEQYLERTRISPELQG